MWFATKGDGLLSLPVPTSPSARPRISHGYKSRKDSQLSRPTVSGMKRSVEFLTSFNNALA